MLRTLVLDQGAQVRIAQQARVLIDGARSHKNLSRLHSLVEGFSLSSREGIALMALAEALLRIPDPLTVEAILEDKLSEADFEKLFGAAPDMVGKISGMGLKMAQGIMGGMAKRMGMPVIRKFAVEGVRTLGSAFVMGETIESALAKANEYPRQIAWSFDMLGEGARDNASAERYFTSYTHAISVLGRAVVAGGEKDPARRHGISVKLSALHPRYQASQSARCVDELAERLTELCRLASEAGLNLTVDAEESERLTLSLQIIDKALQTPFLKNWDGFGLALQAYSKRSVVLTRELIQWAANTNRRLGIRLVKGAYWDTEIKRAQVGGHVDYPVFTRKAHTDLSYLTCAQMLLDNRKFVTPMFGTHNATTAATILDMAGQDKKGFAFQRLYGMGEGLHSQLLSMDIPCSVYAPVGPHQDLLAYLVRRLLENGANSSFVNKIADKTIPTEKLIEDAVAASRASKGAMHGKIPLPANLYPERKNSAGYDIAERDALKALEDAARKAVAGKTYEAFSIIDGKPRTGAYAQDMHPPADSAANFGKFWGADAQIVSDAFENVAEGARAWRTTHPDQRASALEKFADLLEEHRDEFVGLCSREAGKTLADGIAEIREAVDFCRYYAVQACRLFGVATTLPGPTGEQNSIRLEARGTFVCISPWNFPLAIFTGQIAAALAAGNTVVAKPAEQTPIIAQRAVQLMLEAGIPNNAIALIQGDGRVGEMVVSNRRVCGVAFTGSNAAAKAIHKSLADRPGPIIPLIAETGGLNAMIVDSSALPEQVVDDVVMSAFTSAGQRCSALRLLCVQEDIAPTVMELIAGAMDELVIGDPSDSSTDIGPLIDGEALGMVQKHKSRLRGSARIIAETPMNKTLEKTGYFCAPLAAELRSVDDLDREVFGPVLHILTYKAGERDDLLDAINRKGFGLTFGIHSRLWSAQRALASGIRAGNVYINRGMIGAVVGVQPFGGMGLSGTGPKAGGPYYLHAFATEKVISIDTTAAGGNTTLLTQDEGL